MAMAESKGLIALCQASTHPALTPVPTIEHSTPEPNALYTNLIKQLTCDKCGGKHCWLPGILKHIRENLLIFGGLYRLNKTHDS